MRTRSFLIIAVVIVWAAGAAAQTLIMGNPFESGLQYSSTPRGMVTIVDLARPATASGTISHASLGWSSWDSQCPAVATLKFFRPHGATLTLVAERGPVDWIGDRALVPVVPPVWVRAGDLIGIGILPWDPDTMCMGPLVLKAAGHHLQFASDVKGSVAFAAGTAAAGLLAVSGFGRVSSGTSGEVARLLPVVGSTAGITGSRWTTSVQIVNPYTVPVVGRLVFRRAGITGSSADPSLQYALGPGESASWRDVVAATGASGLGSLDVVIENGPVPLVDAEIFNEGAAAEVAATPVPALDPRGLQYPARVLHAGFRGSLVAPDMSGSRFNIGVRTLARGATITAAVEIAPGDRVQSVTRSFPPDYFEQLPAEAFLGFALRGGESVVFEVEQGTAVVYGCTIDNATSETVMDFVNSEFLRREEMDSLRR